MLKPMKWIAVMAIMITLLASVAAGTVVTREVEIRGAVANGSTTYDYTNFGALWYDIDDDRGSESFNITVTNDRTIGKGALVYDCAPVNIEFENTDLNDEYGGYMLIGFMANDYICYDNKTDTLVKLLIEWDSSDKVILTMSDPMQLPDGYILSAQEIDLQGDRVWLKLFQDGKCIDDAIVEGSDTYTYEDSEDVLLFSAKIDSVFRGTEVSGLRTMKHSPLILTLR
jgi:S-layer protein (TIGR01567 family)